MPKRGEVRVLLCRRWCIAVAGLMNDIAARETAASWLVPIEIILEDQAKAKRLSVIMQKTAERKRTGTGFVVNIDRDVARHFANLHMPLGKDFRAIFRAQAAFRKAVNVRRGPRRLSLRSIEDRTDGKIQRNLEHTIRLRRRLRYEKSWLEWRDEVFARGETALTATVPLPKI